MRTMSRFLYPYLILYGAYVTLHGHLTPGGGFQGGAIVATGFLLHVFFRPERFPLAILSTIEKLLYALLLFVGGLSYFTKGVHFTNFFIEPNVLFLILLNFIIGFKVTLGLINIFESFIEEGEGDV